MPQFQKSVSQWSPVVDAELARSQIPLPRDLLLALIHVESRGRAGLVNQKSSASGLLQVMPNTLSWYNESHKANPVQLSELRSSGADAAVKQIRVGLWVLSRFWKSAYNYLSGKLANVPIEDLSHIADLFYVAGPGATRKRLDKLDYPSWAAVQAANPKWNALPHPRNVFAKLEGLEWPTDAISQWLGSAGLFDDKPSAQDGFVISLLGVLIAWYFIRGKGPNK